MKSVPHLVVVAALAFAVVGCGQKGPLYLPAKPAPISTPAAPVAPAPADSSAPVSK
ncbi:LPS translocon maturation chaperone LptM [Noviherbaspirillum sp.]|uniref:LPS translocon maturation chaperone LptM n=1 Tax=Noviherbaspirillum sp. TaxID=1926288 RepID=UPI002B49D68C|nr:lipoprotein [Noviherbaspirillum sp.]HJV82533.1 lipoprotein [Noviherbaspirillum sp.]